MKQKVNKYTYDISSIKHVTRKFLEVLRCSRAKQPQRNVQKKCAARAKLFFSPFLLPSPLSISRFYILFEQNINIIGIRNPLFTLGSIYSTYVSGAEQMSETNNSKTSWLFTNMAEDLNSGLREQIQLAVRARPKLRASE